MPTPANPMMNVYRAQVAGTRQIVDATLAGLDRLERLTMRTLREAAADQFQFAETVSRSLGSANGEDLAMPQSEVTEPATQRLTDRKTNPRLTARRFMECPLGAMQPRRSVAQWRLCRRAGRYW